MQEVTDASGLDGLTVTDDYIDAYHIGDPNNAEGFEEFKEKVRRARASLGKDVSGFDPGVDRIWAYGEGQGSTHG